MSTASGFLHLLKAEPTLLPEAPAGAGAAQIEHRRRDEVHPCLRCGKRAGAAFVADTELGPRWLDLCPGCEGWLRSAIEREGL